MPPFPPLPRSRRGAARAPLAAPAAPAEVAPGQAPAAAPATLPPPRFARAPTVVYRAPVLEPRKRRYGKAGAPFTLAVGGALRFRSEPGYRQLRAQGVQREFDVSASYDLFQPLRRLVIAAGVNYRLMFLGDQDSLEVTTHAVQADVIVRYTAATWLFPQLRAGVGAQLARAKLRDESAQFRAEDRTASAAGSIGAGLLFQTPRRLFETYNGHLASLAIGLLVEGGYAFASDAEFKLKVKSESDLPNLPIALGKLSLGGPYLRIMGVVRF